MTLIFDGLGGNYKSGESNIGTAIVNTEGEYVIITEYFPDLNNVQEGDMFTIQIQNACWLREGENGDGFLVNDIKPFHFVVSMDYPIYVKNFGSPAIINIAGVVSGGGDVGPL